MKDLTEKAAELVNEGDQVDPGDVEAVLPKIEDRVQEIRTRLVKISEPDGNPSLSRVAGLGGTSARHVYDGAGPVWREAAESGDVATLKALEDERAELRQERSLLTRQRTQLRASARRSRERIERESAPDRLADRLEEFSGLLGEAESALAAFRAARQALEEAGSEIVSCRKLVGDDAPGLEPQQLRRWGLIAGAKPGEPTVERDVGADGRPVQHRHLFKTRAQQRERFKALAPPSDDLLEAVRRRVRSERDRRVRYAGQAPEIPDAKVQDAVREARRAAIISGSFETLEPEPETAKAS